MDSIELKKEIFDYIKSLKQLNPKPEQIYLLHEMIELLKIFK